jgi:CPA2 family monovalent cation:H+ antiporter-2
MRFSRYRPKPDFRTLAATPKYEAFTAFTLLLVLAAACATAMIGLSLTLGAFLAGLAVSGTPFRHQVQTEMGPFRGLLLSVFFISVGLAIDLPALVRNLPLVVIAAFGILIVKSALGYVAARLNGWSIPGAMQLGTLLAQGSEFTLVILSLGAVTSNFPPALMSSLIAAIALSLALAPSWAILGGKLSRELARRKQVTMETSSEPAGERPVLVIGMSPAGRLAVDALVDFNIPYIATDSDPDRFLAAVADGYNVSFGDASNMKLIDAVGGSNARAVVLGKARYAVSKEVTPSITRRFPDLIRLVAVESLHDLDRHLELNMRAHLVASEPKGIEMVADMLRILGIPDEDLAGWLSREADLFTIGDASDRQDRAEDRDDEIVEEAA